MMKRLKTKTAVLMALVVLNVALVAVLINKYTPENRAAAAVNVNAAAVLAVPGELPGFSNGVIFLLDTSSNQLAAVIYDPPTQSMQKMNPLDLNKQLTAPGPVRGR